MIDTGTERFGVGNTTAPRTPFVSTATTQPKQSAEINCKIGGKLRATVKSINLTPGDLCKIISKLPANCHIISIIVKQFHHAESAEGEMYNSVEIEYQTDELMPVELNGVFFRGDDSSCLIALCEHEHGESGMEDKEG